MVLGKLNNVTLLTLLTKFRFLKVSLVYIKTLLHF